jgi:putative flippase GtrA
VTAARWHILRFLAVGGLNTAFGYASYAAFILLGAPLWLAVTGATMLAFVFNFISYGGLVFGSTSHRLLPRFFLVYAGMAALNFGLLRVVTGLGLGPLVAQALLVPVQAACGYVAMQGFVFRGQAERATP